MAINETKTYECSRWRYVSDIKTIFMHNYYEITFSYFTLNVQEKISLCRVYLFYIPAKWRHLYTANKHSDINMESLPHCVAALSTLKRMLTIT